MKFTPNAETARLDSDTADSVVDPIPGKPNPIVKTRTRKPASEVPPNQSLSADTRTSTTPTPMEYLIDEYLARAGKLYERSRTTERELLYQRVELGRILIQLKEEVGHGKFMTAFKRSIEEGIVSFSLKTGQRAMGYAELEAAGKFVDAAKNDIVSNLTEAERFRKAEAGEAKAKAEVVTDADADADTDTEVEALATISKSQIDRKANLLAKPVWAECRGYDTATRIALIEELIELLTKKLEEWN